MVEKKGFAVTSLVLGICGVIFFWASLFGVALNVLAIIFGVIGIVKVRNESKIYSGKGMAIAGLVLGIIGLALMLIIIILFAAFFATFLSSLPTGEVVSELLPK